MKRKDAQIQRTQGKNLSISKNRIGASIQIIQNKGKIPHPKERFFNSNTKEKFYNSKKGSILFEFLIVFN